MKNVVVLGGSYGGATAVNKLSQDLPKGYRVILIERNTHANHLYVFPRLAVLPGHEHKAFIPYTHIFDPIPLISNDSGSASDSESNSESSRPSSPSSAAASDSTAPTEPEPETRRHLVLHAHVVGLTPHTVKLDRAFPEHGFDTPEVPFEYAIYALGSRLPTPIDIWAGVGVEGKDEESVVGEVVGGVNGSGAQAVEVHEIESEVGVKGAGKESVGLELERSPYTGSKAEAMAWMKRCQERIRRVPSVLVVGGGALGIQFATDIASLYPDKKVTLLHSRNRLLPRYRSEMHGEIMKAMSELGISVILDERLDLSSVADPKRKGAERIVRTLKGREISAELVMLCTGQTPNTSILRGLDERLVRPDTSLACVLRTMQVAACGQEGDYALEEGPSGEEAGVADEAEAEDENEVAEATEAIAQVTLDPPSTSDDGPASPAASNTDAPPPRSPYPHIFVVGDAADAFGAIKAGHVAFYQAQVAVANIGKLIRASERDEAAAAAGTGTGTDDVKLESYVPSAPAIKVTLGLTRPAVYEISGQIGLKDGADDLEAGSIWPYFGFFAPTEEDLYL